MKKFFKDLDYSFVCLILYIIKSIFLINPIDLGVIGILSCAFIFRYITNKITENKYKIETVKDDFKRFEMVEENILKREVMVENDFRKQVNDHLGSLDAKVASISMNNAYGKRK